MSKIRSLVVATAVLGCTVPIASPPSQPASETATVEVELLRGFRVPDRPLHEVERPLTLVVDVRNGGPAAEVRSRADTLVRHLPEAVDVSLVAVGSSKGDDCAAGERISDGGDREHTRSALGGLATRGVGSLPATLEALEASEPGRVVVVTSLPSTGASCGDLCAAAGSLAARGQWLDWILLGDAPAPACLEALRPRARRPGPFARSMSAGATRVEVYAGRDSDAPMVGEGIVSTPIQVDGGAVTLRVALDPPELVGPLVLEPGERVVVRLLDFPMAEEPLREWRAERR